MREKPECPTIAGIWFLEEPSNLQRPAFEDTAISVAALWQKIKVCSAIAEWKVRWCRIQDEQPALLGSPWVPVIPDGGLQSPASFDKCRVIWLRLEKGGRLDLRRMLLVAIDLLSDPDFRRLGTFRDV